MSSLKMLWNLKNPTPVREKKVLTVGDIKCKESKKDYYKFRQQKIANVFLNI